MSIFSYVCWWSVCLLWKNVYSHTLPIFSQVVCFIYVELCKFFVHFAFEPLIRYIIYKYILSFSRWHFYFVDDFLQWASNFFSLIWSHLFIFAFVSFAWEDISKTILLRLMSNNLLPKFSSRTFMVSDLIFKSLMYYFIMRDWIYKST